MLLSPWTDLSGDGAEAGLAHTSASNVSRKDYVTRGKVAFLAAAARGDLAPDRAPVSPMYAEGSLADLPPIFVVYGKSEAHLGAPPQGYVLGGLFLETGGRRGRGFKSLGEQQRPPALHASSCVRAPARARGAGGQRHACGRTGARGERAESHDGRV